MGAPPRPATRSALIVMVLLPAIGAGCNLITGAGDLVVEDGVTTGGGGAPSGGSGNGGAGAAGNGSPASTTSATSSSSASSGKGSASTTTSSSSTTATTSSSSSTGTSSSGDPLDAAAQACVDTINMYRATLGLAPYARWPAEEACAGQEAQKDSQTMTAHSAFGMCGEWAQDECPGWPGPPASVVMPCLAEMWAEGPGDFNSGHGHYDNMSSTMYTKVACGFYTLSDGSVWATQDFQ